MLNEQNTSLEGETFVSDWERRKKAKSQPRDANGRWIAAGANVTWKGPDNKGFSGTVSGIENGQAVVDANNPDGTTTSTTVDPTALEVITSKARLPQSKSAIYAADNDFAKAINSPKFQDALSTHGKASVMRADGYALEANMKEEKDSSGNPILYQLFAPAGKSLGTYSGEAISSFNDMVEDHLTKDTPLVTPTPAPSGPVVASGVPVRIARNGSTAIMKTGDKTFTVVSLETGAQIQPNTTDFVSLVAGGSWRKVLSSEIEAIVASIPAPEVIEDIVVEPIETVKPYRVPTSVKDDITLALEKAKDVSEEDLKIAQTLAFSDSVSINEINWINNFFASQDVPQKLRGGYKGQKWATKILESYPEEEVEPKHNFAASDLAYFAVSDTEGSPNANNIIAVSFATNEVYVWGADGFTKSEGVSIDDVDEPQITPVDEFTAEALAEWLDSDTEGTFSIVDVDPLERNLFALAESEMDLEQLDTVSSIIAAGEVSADEGYTPLERSINAKKQIRGPGGKFGSGGGGEAKPGIEVDASVVQPGTTAAKAKATLTIDLPLVLTPSQRILDWLDTAPITAAGEPVVDPEAPTTVDGEDPAEPEAPEAESKSLYFAIVDDVDKSAVLDVVAITKNDLNEAEAWLRQNKDWVASQAHLASLQGPTPPPVVELEVPNPAKDVLAQIDNHDGQGASAPAPISPVTAPPAVAPVVASATLNSKGFALPSGEFAIYSIDDLTKAVEEFATVRDSSKAEVQLHITKRARALNRPDLLPAEWRESTPAQRAQKYLSQSPLFGDYGEVIVAGAGDGVAGEAKLKAYWRNGKGAAKIRWGTKGDLTRCHRHLEKYIPGRSWGFCQNLHKEKYGKSNYKRDNGK